VRKMFRLIRPCSRLIPLTTSKTEYHTQTAVVTEQPPKKNSVRLRKIDVKQLFDDSSTTSQLPSSIKSETRKKPTPREAHASHDNFPDNDIINRNKINQQKISSKKYPSSKVNLTGDVSQRLESILHASPLSTTDNLFESPEQDQKERRQQQPYQEKQQDEQQKFSDSSQQQSATQQRSGSLTAMIRQSTNINELLSIFDKYILPVEFAIGLQKLCDLSSGDPDVLKIYLQSDDSRTRIEGLLLSFLSKFTDPEVVTAINFLMKFYIEDNEFTEKVSVGLSARLRRITVHQIVRILDLLKLHRHTAQWLHHIYNRLLTLAEGRYFEFDNIRDILAITYKLSYNDRLINRLDERILEIAETLTYDDWYKILINKSMLKRRDRTILRAACYHLLKSPILPLDKIRDSLFACSMLSIHDKIFLEKLIQDAYQQANDINDPFMLHSLVTSMGTLRLRHCELLDHLGTLLVENNHVFGTSQKCLHSFIRTCAAVNYNSTTLLDSLITDNKLNLNENTVLADMTEQTPTTSLTQVDADSIHNKNKIDLVWSLAILNRATPEHVSTVLEHYTFQHVQNEIANSKIASALKLLSIYSYSLQKFSRKFLKPPFSVEHLAQLTMKSSNIQEQLAKAVTTFAPENKFSKFSVITSNMIVIGNFFYS
ncbi:unnamed protein product, partial [Didymodactylos carnosus]